MEKREIFVKCECGCGVLIPKYTKRGNIRKSFNHKVYNNSKGENNPFFGKKHSDKLKENNRKLGSINFIDRFGEERAKEIGKKISVQTKGKKNPFKGKNYEEMYGKEKAEELKKLRKEVFDKYKNREWTEQERINRSNMMLEKWQDPEYSERTLKNMLKNRYVKPNRFENKITNLCIKYNLPFYYTGDGTFIIGTKNPDFVHKDKKIVIEVFANWFKKVVFGSVEDYMKNRELYFKQFGYQVIFICEEEIESKKWEQICLNKIRDGINGKNK